MLDNSKHLQEYGICYDCHNEYAVAGTLFHRETRQAKRLCEECALKAIEDGEYVQELTNDQLDLIEEERLC